MRYELEEKENRCCWIDLSIKVNKKKDREMICEAGFHKSP